MSDADRFAAQDMAHDFCETSCDRDGCPIRQDRKVEMEIFFEQLQ